MADAEHVLPDLVSTVFEFKPRDVGRNSVVLSRARASVGCVLLTWRTSTAVPL